MPLDGALRWLLCCVVVSAKFNYIQSAFITSDPPDWIVPTMEAKRLRAEGISHYEFNGFEVLNLNVDTPTGRGDVRNMSAALKSLNAGPGIHSFPRMPGFFWPADLAKQPAEYRAKSLCSNGSIWNRAPQPPTENESEISFTGDHLDVTYAPAASALLSNIKTVFASQCAQQSSCIGPLFGYMVLNENKLSDEWWSTWSDVPNNRDVDSPSRVMRYQKTTHVGLFTDDDPYYSFFNPPKRVVPLFSQSAHNSFNQFLKKKGLAPQPLPLDRGEFNDDDASLVPVPSWTAFVPLNSDVWQHWEEWVYETWSKFQESIAQAITEAQTGNPDFHGVLYFQLPMWYSLPKSSQQPVTYSYLDPSGHVVQKTETLANYKEYDRLNPVVMGIDMDYLLASPWFAGMIHESTSALLLVVPPDLSEVAYDQYVENSDRFIHYFMAQGFLAQKVAHANHKLFGSFARVQYFKDAKVLLPQSFDDTWNHTTALFRPDILASIGLGWFIDPARLDPRYKPVLPGCTGELQDVWMRHWQHPL